MIDNNKINQVYAAIIENGMDAFSDEDLIKLLSMLNKHELEEADKQAYDKFYEKYKSDTVAYQNSKRISSLIPLIKFIINDKMYKIRNTNIINYMNTALVNNEYHEFLTKCETKELVDIKYYLTNNVNTKDEVNMRATKKLVSLILKELNSRVGKFN
jgi:hypothetical protein